jgi:hypothetical protein
LEDRRFGSAFCVVDVAQRVDFTNKKFSLTTCLRTIQSHRYLNPQLLTSLIIAPEQWPDDENDQ